MLTCIHFSYTYQAKPIMLKIWLPGYPLQLSFWTLIYKPLCRSVVLTGLRSTTWLFLSNICQDNHMVIPEYPLKTFATEISQINSQNSNHFSFSPNHMVLIPLSMLKQPFIGIKSFIWDTTGISIAGCDSLADNYINNSNDFITSLMEAIHWCLSLFGEAACLSFSLKTWIIKTCHLRDVLFEM